MKIFEKLFAVPTDDQVTEKCMKRVMICAVCSILLCTVCLVSTTWAWYETQIISDNNKITGGQWEDPNADRHMTFVDATEPAEETVTVEITEPVLEKEPTIQETEPVLETEPTIQETEPVIATEPVTEETQEITEPVTEAVEETTIPQETISEES